MNKNFREASDSLHDTLSGKRAKSGIAYDDAKALEGESDDRASDRLAEWIETMKLVEKAAADAPDTRAGKRRSAQAISKMQRELSVEKLRAHVGENVRDTCTRPVRAAFALITADHDTFEDALQAANGIPDDEAKDIRLSKAKLREVLKEYFYPSRDTLAGAEIAPDHHMFFTKPNVGSTKTGAR